MSNVTCNGKFDMVPNDNNMYWFNKLFEQNNKKCANNDINIIMNMQKKKTPSLY